MAEIPYNNNAEQCIKATALLWETITLDDGTVMEVPLTTAIRGIEASLQTLLTRDPVTLTDEQLDDLATKIVAKLPPAVTPPTPEEIADAVVEEIAT